MTRIVDILCAEGLGAFFYDDQAAIAAGAESDGFLYRAQPLTAGFEQVRIPARSLGVGLVLADGSVAWGDMMNVQYAGAGGREPPLDLAAARGLVERVLRPRLVGLPAGDFRGGCAVALAPHADGPIGLAAQYGISQALLRAAAAATGASMAEVICAEYGLPVIAAPVPLYAQSGDARAVNVDKMILKAVDVLPHGLINAREKFGAQGEAFLEFVAWVAARVRGLGGEGYRPTLHFDVYGWVGRTFGHDPDRIAAFIARAADTAGGLRFQIEHPADFGGRDAQIEGLSAVRRALARLGSPAAVVADEWCNTLTDIEAFAQAGAADLIQIKTPDVGSVADSIAAVLACRAHGVGAYVGGSCAETDLSAQVSVHVAVAARADMLLAKPGMGVDEGLTIVGNEQSRLLAILARRNTRRAEAAAYAF